jgi:hypothetical protein
MENSKNASPLFRAKGLAGSMGVAEIPERIFRKIYFDPNSGCWLWVGARDQDGYAIAKVRRSAVRVSGYLYRSMVGPIPEGLELDHFHCSRRPCVCPYHVRPVTHTENVRRSARWPRKLV